MISKLARIPRAAYLCPDEFEKRLIESLEEENIFRPLATVIKTSSGDRKIPIITQKGEAAWLEEESSYSLSDDAFGQIALSAYKVGTAIKISEELLNDSVFDLPAYIAKEFGRRIGAKEEEAFLIGDGKGKPTGIFAATGGAENGATTSTANITFDDMIEVFYSLKSPYRKKAVWILNEQTIKILRKNQGFQRKLFVAAQRFRGYSGYDFKPSLRHFCLCSDCCGRR